MWADVPPPIDICGDIDGAHGSDFKCEDSAAIRGNLVRHSLRRLRLSAKNQDNDKDYDDKAHAAADVDGAGEKRHE